MTSTYQHIQPGTNVYGSDGDKVGDVSEVGANYVLVRQGWLFTKDIYIPLSAIVGADDDGIRLNVTKDQIGDLGWDVMPTDEGTTAAYGATTSGVTDAGYAATSTVQETSARTDYTATQRGTADVDTSGEVAIPIVEEELLVGKRAVESGGVQVTTRVEEVPVTEQVTLRDETIAIERRPVDRPVADADLAAVQEGSFEIRERDEQAIVEKQARIVEEVVINKDVTERTETIQDTVRRTDVDIEEIPGQTRSSGYVETGRVSTSDVAGAGTISSTAAGTGATTGPDEGALERGLSQTGNAAERATGLDLDRDQDVGQRDPRNNY